MSQLSLNIARCEALFASTLQPCDDTDPDGVRTGILRALRAFGVRGCAARVAEEFGDHPDLAVPRMQWARGVVARLYGPNEDSADPTGANHRPAGVTRTPCGSTPRGVTGARA